MRTCQLMQLVCRWVNATTGARVVISIQPLPTQLELTVCASSGGHGFCDPTLWIRSYLLINPLLKPLFIGRSPTLASQRLTRKVILRVLLNLCNSLITQVRTNNLQTRRRKILTIKCILSVVVQRT